MDSNDLNIYDLVELEDGRIGIILEKYEDGYLALEPREEDHGKPPYGGDVFFDADPATVVRVLIKGS